MPAAGEIAKLFGFVAKNTPWTSHAVNAGIGMGAKGAYNLATGRDLTEGMVGWGVMGAAAGAGWKTYKNMGLAGRLSKAEAGYAGVMEKLRPVRSAARAATGDARKAAFAEARTLANSASGYQSEFNAIRKDLGLPGRGSARANRAVQQGGVVGASAATAERHSTISASRPVNMSDFYSRRPTGDDFYHPGKGPKRSSGRRGPIVTPPPSPAPTPSMPLRTYDMSMGAGIMQERGFQSRAANYNTAAKKQASEFTKTANIRPASSMDAYRSASLNWAS